MQAVFVSHKTYLYKYLKPGQQKNPKSSSVFHAGHFVTEKGVPLQLLFRFVSVVSGSWTPYRRIAANLHIFG